MYFVRCEGSVNDFNIELQVLIDTQPSAKIKRIKWYAPDK